MRFALAGLAGVLIVLAGSEVTAQPAAAPATSAAAPSASTPSVETTSIADLLADPATKAVLQKDMPALISYDGLDQIKGMTLRDISKYPQAQLDDAKLAAIQKDFNAAKGH
jgi:para-nitrobenzyl esterase